MTVSKVKEVPISNSLWRKLLGIYINPDEIEKDIRATGYLDLKEFGVSDTGQEALAFLHPGYSSHFKRRFSPRTTAVGAAMFFSFLREPSGEISYSAPFLLSSTLLPEARACQYA